MGDAKATLTKGYERDGALLVMGPKSRDLLSQLTEGDLSAPWMSERVNVAGVPVTALRVSYVGELGWDMQSSTPQRWVSICRFWPLANCAQHFTMIFTPMILKIPA